MMSRNNTTGAFCGAYHDAAGSVTKEGGHIVRSGKGWHALILQHVHGFEVRAIVRTRVNGHSVYLTDGMPARFGMDTVRPQSWAVRTAPGSVRVFETRAGAERFARGRCTA